VAYGGCGAHPMPSLSSRQPFDRTFVALWKGWWPGRFVGLGYWGTRPQLFHLAVEATKELSNKPGRSSNAPAATVGSVPSARRPLWRSTGELTPYLSWLAHVCSLPFLPMWTWVLPRLRTTSWQAPVWVPVAFGYLSWTDFFSLIDWVASPNRWGRDRQGWKSLYYVNGD